MKAQFFATPARWRAWLAKHHDSKDELLVGFYKKGSGKPSITWPESVDEALCFGWIDGVRRSLGEDAYTIRFTPRRKGSIWSAVNLKRVAELTKEGRMHAAGLKVHGDRKPDRASLYAYEQRKTATLPEAYRKKMEANAKAAKFFDAQPPGYRHLLTFYVISARKEETQLKRLDRLIKESAAGRRIT